VFSSSSSSTDETFTVHLSGASSGAKLMLNSTLVIIVDDHEPGQLSFPERFYTVKESQQCAIVPVSRTYARETNACFVSAEF